MGIKFSKMHSLGNDFMLINALNQHLSIDAYFIKKYSDRHTGIGFDQCLILEKSHTPGIDFYYRIFNANGNEVGQCGNGARCLARFIQKYQLSSKHHLKVQTSKTHLELFLNEDETVTVNMGKPNFKPDLIPLKVQEQALTYQLSSPEGMNLRFHALSLGNPHAIFWVENVEYAPVDKVGEYLNTHPSFPEGVNVGFMQILNQQEIKLRVYERGCGETLACGSGASAAAAAGILFHGLNPHVNVHLKQGALEVSWASPEDSLYLKGPATFIFEGELLN